MQGVMNQRTATDFGLADELLQPCFQHNARSRYSFTKRGHVLLADVGADNEPHWLRGTGEILC